MGPVLHWPAEMVVVVAGAVTVTVVVAAAKTENIKKTKITAEERRENIVSTE